MSAPPAPVVQPVSLMNQLSAIASMNAASAVSAYSGPGDRLPAPMPPPVIAIHVLPKTGPYHRNPMTIAATVAMMIATQFMFPSSNARRRAQVRAGAQAFRPRARTPQRPGRNAHEADAPRSSPEDRAPERSPGEFRR